MGKVTDHEQQLLKQLHHRVKNNLQVICSLLRLQSNYSQDEAIRAMFRNSEERVRSMALIHEKLCGNQDPSSVQFDEYVSSLVDQLLKSYPSKEKPVRVELQLESIRLPIEQAVPCGLIINELVTNSLKYGCRNEGAPYLGVRLRRSDDEIELEVRDNGPGLPDGFDISKPKSLGIRVVQALSRQLAASFSVESSMGTTFRLRFRPAESYRVMEGESYAAVENTGV